MNLESQLRTIQFYLLSISLRNDLLHYAKLRNNRLLYCERKFLNVKMTISEIDKNLIKLAQFNFIPCAANANADYDVLLAYQSHLHRLFRYTHGNMSLDELVVFIIHHFTHFPQ